MKDLLAKLKEIGEKSDYLNQKSQDLVEENRALKARVSALETQLKTRDSEMNTLADQYEIVKLARNMDGGNGDEQAEKIKDKINEYIREIDQCLKLIGD